MMKLSDVNLSRRAFTLVELLVVIAIIGLLSSVAVVATSSARQNSRNTRRIADILQFQKAFALAYDSVGGFPYSGAANGGTACISATCYGAWSTLAAYGPLDAVLFPTYMGNKPIDPPDTLRNSGGYLFDDHWAGGNGLPAGIVLVYKLEGATSCGPGTFQVGNSSYTQCVLYLQ